MKNSENHKTLLDFFQNHLSAKSKPSSPDTLDSSPIHSKHLTINTSRTFNPNPINNTALEMGSRTLLPTKAQTQTQTQIPSSVPIIPIITPHSNFKYNPKIKTLRILSDGLIITPTFNQLHKILMKSKTSSAQGLPNQMNSNST